MSNMRAAGILACTLCLLASPVVRAALIYQCVDATGKRLTSDRPIAACTDREQRQLNPDGSTRRVIPPSMTSEERQAAESTERIEQAKRASKKDEIRRDRMLAARFPNQSVHNAAREAALNDAHRAVRLSEARITTLTLERQPLLEESEFYVGKPLPPKLKQLLDANDAATDAQLSLLQNQQEEIVRINANFDAELERLRRIWTAASPGAVLPVSTATPASAGASAARRTERQIERSGNLSPDERAAAR
ncbi:MAG: DUF4124 domain-containing protein [Burkholderiaceae bacterium]